MTDSCCGTALSSTPGQMQSSAPRVFRARKSTQSSNRIQLSSLHRLLDKHGNEIHLGTENKKLKTKVEWTRLEETQSFLITRHGSHSEGKSLTGFTPEEKPAPVSSLDLGHQIKYQRQQGDLGLRAKTEQCDMNGGEANVIGIAQPQVGNSKNGCTLSFGDSNVEVMSDHDTDCLNITRGDALKIEQALGAHDCHVKVNQCVGSTSSDSTVSSPINKQETGLGGQNENLPFEKESPLAQLHLDNFKENCGFGLDDNELSMSRTNQDHPFKVNHDSTTSVSPERKSTGVPCDVTYLHMSDTNLHQVHTNIQAMLEKDTGVNAQPNLSQAESMDSCEESNVKSTVRMENNNIAAKLEDKANSATELVSSLRSDIQEDKLYPREGADDGCGGGAGSACNGLVQNIALGTLERGFEQSYAAEPVASVIQDCAQACGANKQCTAMLTENNAQGDGTDCTRPSAQAVAHSAQNDPPPEIKWLGSTTEAVSTKDNVVAVSKAHQNCSAGLVSSWNTNAASADYKSEGVAARDCAPDATSASVPFNTSTTGGHPSIKRPAEEQLVQKQGKIVKRDNGRPETNGSCVLLRTRKAVPKLDVEKEVERVLLTRLGGGRDFAVIGERMKALSRRLEVVEKGNRRHESLTANLQASLQCLQWKLNAALDALNTGTRHTGNTQVSERLRLPQPGPSNLVAAAERSGSPNVAVGHGSAGVIRAAAVTALAGRPNPTTAVPQLPGSHSDLSQRLAVAPSSSRPHALSPTQQDKNVQSSQPATLGDARPDLTATNSSADCGSPWRTAVGVDPTAPAAAQSTQIQEPTGADVKSSQTSGRVVPGHVGSPGKLAIGNDSKATEGAALAIPPLRLLRAPTAEKQPGPRDIAIATHVKDCPVSSSQRTDASVVAQIRGSSSVAETQVPHDDPQDNLQELKQVVSIVSSSADAVIDLTEEDESQGQGATQRTTSPAPCLAQLPPLPEAPAPSTLCPLPPEAAKSLPPQKATLTVTRSSSQIVLCWNVRNPDDRCAAAEAFYLYACHQELAGRPPMHWRRVGEVKALRLPMACTLSQFGFGKRYYFAVRGRDSYGRYGPFCEPQCTELNM
uniref:Activating transcription factor 7-interacting protein 1-like isoform X1 n=1 Tax=Petromyzon marinus TaxID=7757 RepID=A0AAJ7TY45_PETMA|nr:activating transcription factor 7-interacting protein 1-like isoform X1 [Petromyzon marinus]